MTRDIDCPPYDFGRDDSIESPRSILDYAANAQTAVNRYRATVDQHGTFEASMRAARALAVATQALVSAIADRAAEGD